ncbi:alternative ribosome rescue aminoacyl-tRNA hydrolase ArfB [Kitasatospora sp. NPDC004723]|uniref:alternative ribosome rescue aminoacyl-tRNA hydrolase ArfB n=1 Tax=Kitasatospora sp. NPDC004723 TaxID=3154288 RepID=UPI0033BD1F1B
MPEPIRVRGSVVVPDAELVWRFSRSSGPGGQHVNTSDTQVELRYDLAASTALPEVWKQRALERLAGRLADGRVLVVRASEHRSQWRNREIAAARLASLLGEATAPPPKARRATKPSRGMVERRLSNKRHRSELKQGRRSPRGEG